MAVFPVLRISCKITVFTQIKFVEELSDPLYIHASTRRLNWLLIRILEKKICNANREIDYADLFQDTIFLHLAELGVVDPQLIGCMQTTRQLCFPYSSPCTIAYSYSCPYIFNPFV